MNSSRTIWIVVLVALLVLCLCCALLVAAYTIIGPVRNSVSLFSQQIEANTSEAQSVNVQTPATLSLDVPVGDITVRPGGDGTITVQTTKRVWGSSQASAQDVLNRIEVGISQFGSSVQVTVTGIDSVNRLPRSPQVNLVVTAPRDTTLTVNNRVGAVTVGGLRGDLAITADVGEVTVSDVSPVKTFSVHSRVASIEVQGPLVPGASYDLQSDVGRVVVQVPSGSAFTIDARSDVGDVNVGFPVSGQSSREGFVGKQVSGEVGNAPSTSLYLRSRVGSISVEPAD